MTKTLRNYNVSISRITLKNLEHNSRESTLESELGAVPVPALGIIPDGVVLGKLLLDPERLLGRHFRWKLYVVFL